MFRILILLALLLAAPVAQAAPACGTTHTATCFTSWRTGPESNSAPCGHLKPSGSCTWAWDAAGQSPVLVVDASSKVTFEVPSTISGSVEVWHCANTTYAGCTQLQLRNTAGVFTPVELDATTTTGEGAEPHAYWFMNATAASGSITVTAGQ
jgi:hypothetical protein